MTGPGEFAMTWRKLDEALAELSVVLDGKDEVLNLVRRHHAQSLAIMAQWDALPLETRNWHRRVHNERKAQQVRATAARADTRFRAMLARIQSPDN